MSAYIQIEAFFQCFVRIGQYCKYCLMQKNMGNKLQSTSKQGYSLQIIIKTLQGKLQGKLKVDNESLLSKLQKLFFQNDSEQDRKAIKKLLTHWNQDNIQVIFSNKQLFAQENIKFYKNHEVLSARVYHKIQGVIKSLQKQSNNIALTKFYSVLNKEKLQFSLDRLFLSRRAFKLHNRLKDIPDESKRKQQQASNRSLVGEVINNITDPLLQRCFQLMKLIGLFSLKQEGQMDNVFMANMQRISSEFQREMYFQSMRLPMLQSLRNIAKDNDQEMKIYRRYLPNYSFYRQRSNQSIELLHKKQKDYDFLEHRHDYIQRMFPNHYGSSFNAQSQPLNYIESRLFTAQYNIGFKVLKSIYIFFDFLGINIKILPLSLEVISQKRMKEALIINTHNHLRVMRILACLSVIGFRRIALQFIKFLDEHTQKQKMLQKFRGKFMNNWQIYGDQAQNGGKLMCFLQSADYPSDHGILNEFAQNIKKQTESKL